MELNPVDERVLVDRPGVRGPLAQRLAVGLTGASHILFGNGRERDKLDGVDLDLAKTDPVAAALPNPGPLPQADREGDVSRQDVVAQLAAEVHIGDASAPPGSDLGCGKIAPIVCRLFGLHAGAQDVNATFWLLDAPVSIAQLSHRNADGYGLATFDGGGELDLVRAPIRAADDEEFAAAARATHASVFLAHVRYADTGPTSAANTHPFILDGRAFAHNGVVSDLDELDRRLGADRALVQGETDSERFFALMTQAIREHEGDVRAGIIASTAMLARDITLYSLNFLLAAAGHLWALRYPEHNDLYVLARAPGGPRGDQPLDEHSAHGTIRMRAAEGSQRPLIVVASEPMDEDLGWEEVAPGELLHIGPDLELDREIILDAPPRKPLSLSGRAADSQAQES